MRMQSSDSNREGDVAMALIHSVLCNSLEESSNSAVSQAIQINMALEKKLPPTLFIRDIIRSKLSNHHTLLDLDLSNSKITKVDGLDAMKSLRRYDVT